MKKLAVAKKILNEVDANISLIKEKYSNYYRENIGKIINDNAMSFAGFVVSENIAPRENSTTRIEKNLFILKKDDIYLPFRVDSKPLITDDLKEKYSHKFKNIVGLTKKELLENLYKLHMEDIKSKKITKKTIEGMGIKEASVFLSENNIGFLSDALEFYSIKTSNSLTMKRGLDASLGKEHALYDDFSRYKELSSQEALLKLGTIKKELSKEIDTLSNKIINTDFKGDDYFSVVTRESIEPIMIPKDQAYVELGFFTKDVNLKKMSNYLKSTGEQVDMIKNFVFFEACENLSQVANVLNNNEYAINMSYANKVEYDEIKLSL